MMANPEHLKILKQGVEVWNKWREENPIIRADLDEADLSHVNLKWADLSSVKLRGADLSRTDLSQASLIRANLSRANLVWANLSGADISRADLSHANLSATNLSATNLKWADLNRTDLFDANLSGADLSRANLESVDLNQANLRSADLSGTKVGITYFVDVDLSDVKGLDTVRHRGPSYIDSHTLYRSQGNIPDVFLRGCGLSDVQIEMAKLHNPHLTEHQITDITYNIHNLLTGDAIQYNSCFISYASPDQAFAERIYTDLQNSGVRCWFAPEDMKIGAKIRHSIDQAIRLQDKLLLILSARSVQSEWVGDEVEHALELEKERGALVLFPLRVDDTVLESKIGWAAKLKRDRHIGDFCGWPDEGAYQQGFERLLNDLKAAG